MNIVRKIIRKLIHFLGKKRLINPRITMVLLHSIELSRYPNLKNPIDFNEKLMWLEHNVDTSIWSFLSDKYEVRKYVKEKGFSDILIPLISLYNSFDEIEFSALPNQFIIKSTNGSEQVIPVFNKINIDQKQLQKQIKKWFKYPFGLSTGESHYLKIKPRIIIEKLLSSDSKFDIIDYKFYCFNGNIEGCLVITERDLQNKTYKLNMINPYIWEEISGAILPEFKGQFNNIKRPQNLNRMIGIASSLSKEFPFVRVDLYNIEGQIFFGEMTFTPAGCRQSCMPRTYLIKLGNLLQFDF